LKTKYKIGQEDQETRLRAVEHKLTEDVNNLVFN